MTVFIKDLSVPFYSTINPLQNLRIPKKINFLHERKRNVWNRKQLIKIDNILVRGWFSMFYCTVNYIYRLQVI